ncbi:NF041680 family putative transposase [Streptomyces sp. NPDC001680]
MGPTMPGLAAVVEGEASARRRLTAFRKVLYRCLRRRADALFELVDAVLTAPGRVGSLVEFSEVNAFRRGHGALYDALACGTVDTGALRGLLAGAWGPVGDGPLKIAVDVSPWPRPDAETSAERCHCYTACRCDGSRKTIPGWPYSFAAGLEWGASSWTALLDAVRIGQDDDATLATVCQVARIIGQLRDTGLLADRPAPVIVLDSGYDLSRISYLAGREGLAVQVLGRVRSDRVFYGRASACRRDGRPGRPPRHGDRYPVKEWTSWPAPDGQVHADSPRYGKVEVSAWHGLHQKLGRQGGWAHLPARDELPIVAGTLIRIHVGHLPGNRTPEDVWLWHNAPAETAFDLDLLWKTYLRRFDLEHTFKTLKTLLGWTLPQIRTPAQGDRWTWLILAAHTQLRLARHLAPDLRRRWEKPLPAHRTLTPGRVHRGFAHLRRLMGTPARKPKPTTPGPGRPPGSTRPGRIRHPVGKMTPTPKKNNTVPSPEAGQNG